ncbi:hypothetical protein MW344_003783 [Vibrio parahaemolyticus]|uniref:Uncharacterized protein n=1 Tax=Vibrio parahaemolyticus TaxID=670 RepID=A0A9Q3UIG5_VIBPH|nr:hypothetical protein [Vibrio parahaemolyticus]EGQ8101951.1 hypothetical protein [Vibrio parahaemolyticus]EGQ8548736.1 hypothetical protein [Vibrio parahaemolyticus]EGQ9073835.1 hypothetical protein [Vibrio parahaemolyticus]EGQ9129658.1 hypothetical protein [Vibrio parahaemolyticus]EGQ9286417.1 hypothetical protein [Vibrio parahaemolyticus]
MKTEFTQAEVAKLPFAQHVLRKGIQTEKKVAIDAEGNHWHITDVYLPDVVGSLDSRYAGKTWLELFPCTDAPYGLKRCFERIRDLQRNPDYYRSEEEKRNYSFCNIDGELYIDDGHHRTVIGRVFLTANGFEPVMKNVLVAYYTRGLFHRIRIFPRRLKHRLINSFDRLNRLIGKRV